MEHGSSREKSGKKSEAIVFLAVLGIGILVVTGGLFLLWQDRMSQPTQPSASQPVAVPQEKTTFATLATLKEVANEDGQMKILLDRGGDFTVIPGDKTEFVLYRFEGAEGEKQTAWMFRMAPPGSSVVIEAQAPLKDRAVVENPTRIRLFLYP